MDMAVATDLPSTFSRAGTRVGAQLEKFLPLQPGDLRQAMRHAALGGGKRLRAALVIESARLFDVPPVQADHAAAAVECIHAYSLVHDDLPCMDDDDLRRGQPTVHVRWDEATAVLAGDALQALAFDILSNPDTHPDASVRLELIRRLSNSAGANGMVGGQATDIAAQTAQTPYDLDSIVALQDKKTGALIRWSAEAGAVLAGADTLALGRYASALGLAFQIRDDILDIEGSEQETGKRVGKDAGANKATFVSLLGLQAAKARAVQLIESANDALSPYGPKADALRQVAAFTISRRT